MLWTIYTVSFCMALVILVFFLVLIGESKSKAFEAQRKALDAEYLCLSHELNTELDAEKVELLVARYPDFESDIINLWRKSQQKGELYDRAGIDR